MKKRENNPGSQAEMEWTLVVANGGSSLIQNRDSRAKPFLERGSLQMDQVYRDMQNRG